MDLFSKEFLKCLCCCLDSIVVSFWFLLQCTVHMSVTHTLKKNVFFQVIGLNSRKFFK